MKNVLLVAMPDATLPFDRVVKIPNLGLCSLAGNLEGRGPGTTGFKTSVLDLVLDNRRSAEALTKALVEIKPAIVGISAMSFQYESAVFAGRLVKGLLPKTNLALGGYHATLATAEIIADPNNPFDFIVSGEGEESFQDLCRAIDAGSGYDRVKGLRYRENGSYVSTSPAPLLDLKKIKLPDRNSRLGSGYHLLGKSFDCIETSRGCLMGCSFCSISGMYGNNYREYEIDRVLEDITNVKRLGSRGIFIVDDNVTMNVERFQKLLLAIIEHKLNDLDYVIQASVAGILKDKRLAELMQQAGIKIVFLGIENDASDNLNTLNKSHKAEMAATAVNLLKQHRLIVFGGFIVANPDDTADKIKGTFRYIKKLDLDHAIVQCLTPYPGTEIRRKLLAAGLVDNPDDYTKYNGFTCNVRTNHLSRYQINRLLLTEGFRYYLNPRYRTSSNFLRSYKRMVPKLILNDFSFLAGAARGEIFMSRHQWK